jgi:hypothetical protein
MHHAHSASLRGMLDKEHRFHNARRLPFSPTLNISYASQVTTPPGSLLQHHFMTLARIWRTCQSVGIPNESVPYHHLRHLDLVGQRNAAQCFSVGLGQEIVADECSGSAGI